MSENGSPIQLVAEDVTVQVDGYWLRHYATDFLSAARSFVEPENKRFSPVRYYLICHSIELSLKAYLFTSGYKKKDRKKLNHNIELALSVAEQNGIEEHISITKEERDAVKKANKLYPKKEFEYFESLETIYDPHDFDLDALDSLAERLIKSIEKPIMDTMYV
jgi:hypothetical protein